MNDILETLLVMGGILLFIFIFIYILNLILRPTKKELKVREKPRKLTTEEINFMADYFHNQQDFPDFCGFMGNYYLPKEVMEVYIKKYSEERGWEE